MPLGPSVAVPFRSTVHSRFQSVAHCSGTQAQLCQRVPSVPRSPEIPEETFFYAVPPIGRNGVTQEQGLRLMRNHQDDLGANVLNR